MRSLCSWVLCTCLLASTPLVAQLSSDASVADEKKTGQELEEFDSLPEDEIVLLIERWEDRIGNNSEDSDWSEWLADLRRKRNIILTHYQVAEKELKRIELQNTELIQRQEELVGLIRDLVIEEEPALPDDSSEDSISQIQAEERQESIRVYEQELSLIEQSLISKEIAIRTSLTDIDDLREHLFELETEIEDMEMIQAPMDVLTTIDEE